MESTRGKKGTKGPSGEETFPEARLIAASGGLQGRHHRRYTYMSPQAQIRVIFQRNDTQKQQ